MKKAKSTAINRSKNSKESVLTIHTILAGYMIIMLFLQLFTFEDFWSLIAVLGFSEWGSKIVSVVLVILELFALPFWLRMKLPRGLSLVSIISGVAALALLLTLEVMGFMFEKVMIFGATFTFPAGAWTLVLLFALVILEACALLEIKLLKPDKP